MAKSHLSFDNSQALSSLVEQKIQFFRVVHEHILPEAIFNSSQGICPGNDTDINMSLVFYQIRHWHCSWLASS